MAFDIANHAELYELRRALDRLPEEPHRGDLRTCERCHENGWLDKAHRVGATAGEPPVYLLTTAGRAILQRQDGLAR